MQVFRAMRKPKTRSGQVLWTPALKTIARRNVLGFAESWMTEQVKYGEVCSTRFCTTNDSAKLDDDSAAVISTYRKGLRPPSTQQEITRSAFQWLSAFTAPAFTSCLHQVRAAAFVDKLLCSLTVAGNKTIEWPTRWNPTKQVKHQADRNDACLYVYTIIWY